MTDFASFANSPAEPARSARYQSVLSAWGEVRPSGAADAGSGIGASTKVGAAGGIGFGGRSIEKCSVGDLGGCGV